MTKTANAENEKYALALSAVCVCGAVYDAVVDLPDYCELSDAEGNFYKCSTAEHVIVKCPKCNRLLNVGNGLHRETEVKAKNEHEQGVYVQDATVQG